MEKKDILNLSPSIMKIYDEFCIEVEEMEEYEKEYENNVKKSVIQNILLKKLFPNYNVRNFPLVISVPHNWSRFIGPFLKVSETAKRLHIAPDVNSDVTVSVIGLNNFWNDFNRKTFKSYILGLLESGMLNIDLFFTLIVNYLNNLKTTILIEISDDNIININLSKKDKVEDLKVFLNKILNDIKILKEENKENKDEISKLNNQEHILVAKIKELNDEIKNSNIDAIRTEMFSFIKDMINIIPALGPMISAALQLTNLIIHPKKLLLGMKSKNKTI